MSADLKGLAKSLAAALACATMPLMAAKPDPSCDPLVSVPELIADPGAFDGKRIWVVAMIFTGYENRSACPSADDKQTGHCLWVDVDAGPLKSDQDFADYRAREATLERFSEQAVALHATFDRNETGHLGMWPGGLRHVTELAGREGGWSFAEDGATPRHACAAKLPEETSEEKVRRGDYAGAIAVLDQAIERDPRVRGNWLMRAAAKKHQLDYAGAIADYTHLIESPEEADKSAYFWFRGGVRELASDLDGAIADYSRAIELEPDVAEFYASRAVAREKAGKHAGAKADQERVERIKSGQ
jgi:tetratricopeptide (TPR) repeat protein